MAEAMLNSMVTAEAEFRGSQGLPAAATPVSTSHFHQLPLCAQ